jgi:hypothetical protein
MHHMYAPSDNGANLPQSEMVDAKDAPDNQCEETCSVGYLTISNGNAGKTLKILHTAHA